MTGAAVPADARGLPTAQPPRPRPPFGERHEARRAELRAYVERELRPAVARYERERWFPNEVFSKLAARGLLGLKYPPEVGGEGGDHLDDAIFVEELARCGSGGLAAAIGAHTGIATPPVWKFGTPDQYERFLVPAIRGEKIAALGITEPGAGSDVASIRTVARRVEGGYLVNGAKTYITNGVRADFVVTAVKTTAEGGHHGISFLILERSMEGFSVSRELEKLGWHASDTGELAFQDVFVPEENLLGGENRGFYLIMANFQWERLLMALGATGAMELILERTVALAEAGSGARPGDGRQALRHAIAEMALELEAGRALTYEALRRFHAGADAIRQVTMAKLATQRSCYELAETALRLHAEAGLYTSSDDGGDRDAPSMLAELDRAARDARLGPIGGGTDEVMKEILAKGIGL